MVRAMQRYTEHMSVEERLAELEARLAVLEGRRATPLVVERVEQVAEELETKLGTYWLSRLGIVSLITGAALLVVTHFAALGPIARVAAGYALAAAVAFAGRVLARRQQALGDIVFGGGLAIAYFVTYALHFVGALRVIDSAPIGMALLAVVIAAIVFTAHRMKSETVAGVALFLGLHTGVVSTELSLFATTLLACGAGFFLAVNRWVIVPLSTVVAVYTTHAILAMHGGDPALRAAFVAIDFSVFAIAAQLIARPLPALAMLNWLGALGLGGIALAQLGKDALFLGGAGFAVALALLALAQYRRKQVALVELGCAIATLAIVLPVKLDGIELVAAWCTLAVAAMRIPALPLLLASAALAVAQQDPAALVVVAATFAALERLVAQTRIFASAGVAAALLFLLPALPGWAGVAAACFAAGFALHAPAYRWCGFAVLGATGLRLIAISHLSTDERIATFVAAGAAMLAASYAYGRRALKQG